MKLKTISLLVLWLFVGAWAFGQRLTKKALYTFKDNEKLVFADEHQIRLSPQGVDYVFYIQGITAKDTSFWLLCNGKESPHYAALFYPELTGYDTTNAYYVVGQRKDANYVYANGVEFGPFDEISPQGNSAYHLKVGPEGDVAFAGSRNDAWKVFYGNTSYTPHDPSTYRFDPFELVPLASKRLVFSSEKNGKKVVNVAGKELPAVDEVLEMGFGDGGSFVVYYKTDDKYFVRTESQTYGPYAKTGYSQVNKKGDFCISYLDNNVWYVLTRNGKLGPFEAISEYYGMKLDDAGHYWFGYRDGNKWFVFADGKSYPAGDDYSAYYFYNDQNFGLRYVEGGMQYVAINNKKYGPYQKAEWTDNYDLYQVKLAGKNEFAFVAKLNGFNLVNHSGEEGAAFGLITKPELHPGNIVSYRIADNNQFYFFYDGKKNGPFDECGFSYNPIAVNAKGLFAEPVRQGNKWHVCTNYQLSDAYAKVFDAQVASDGTLVVVAGGSGEGVQEVYLNNRKVGAFNNVEGLNCVSATLWWFVGDGYLWVNGVNNGKAEIATNPERTSFVVVSDNGVSANGKELSKSPAYLLRYSAKLASFYWLSIENKTIVANIWK